MSAFIGSLSNLGNMAMQSITNSQMLEQQNELLKKQQGFQIYMNNNQYQQYRRSLEGAGLNVNSQLGGFSNTDSPSPASPPALTSPAIDANSIYQGALASAQVANINADTQLKNVQAGNTQMDTLLKETQNWSMRQKTPEEVSRLHEETNKILQETENLRVQKGFIEKQIEKCQSEIGNIDIQTSWLLDSYDNRLQQLAQDIAVKQSQGALNYAQCAVAYKSLSVMSKQIQLIDSQISLNQQQFLELQVLTTNLAIDGDFKQFELDIKKKFGETQAEAILRNINEQTLNLQSQTHWRPLSAIAGVGTAVAGAAFVVK